MDRFIRGLHIDFRAEKLLPGALSDVLKEAEENGYNTIFAEYMDAFPYEGTLRPLRAEDALTKEELTAFVSEAESLGMTVVPLVQCFGHMYWVLRHPEFAPLAEGYHEGMTRQELREPCGWTRAHTMCPSNPESTAFYAEMVSQVLSLHPRCRMLHIGGDELGKLSCPACHARIEQDGLAEVIASHYLACISLLEENGIRAVMWADMAIAYPETLDRLRGHVILMDWDYWSDGTPTEDGRLWGQKELLHKPDEWPSLMQRLFRPYFYYHEPDLIQPFPYIRALKAQGFDVILASAARCGSDSFCIPSGHHAANVAASVRAAQNAGITGFLVTSWAVRRSPWPLTAYALERAAFPDMSKNEYNRRFALRHFGVEDAELGELPVVLGNAASAAARQAGFIESYNEYSDYDTGNFYTIPYDMDQEFYTARLKTAQSRPDAVSHAYAALEDALTYAESLLGRAKPSTPRQHYELSLWKWAISVLRFYCEVSPFLAHGNASMELLETFISRGEALRKETVYLLSTLYTSRTLDGAAQTRFDVCLNCLRNIAYHPHMTQD